MDNQTFRKLSVDALKNRLDKQTRTDWEQHRLLHPECAHFYARLAAADAAISSRFLKASHNKDHPESTPATPQERDHRREVRRLTAVLLIPFAALLGAVLGAFLMMAILDEDGTQRSVGPTPSTAGVEEPAEP